MRKQINFQDTNSKYQTSAKDVHYKQPTGYK